MRGNWATQRKLIMIIVKTRKLSHICKPVVTRLLLRGYQDVFALFVPSCCDKSGTSCYHLYYKVDDGNRLVTSCFNKTLIQAVRVTGCYELVVIKLLTTCYVQTISDLLEQLVASVLTSSTLLQDDNSLFQTCQQLGSSSANTSSFLLTSCKIST